MNITDQLKNALVTSARQRAVIKLINDRAGFALEYASGDEDSAAIVRGLAAQFKAIQKDAAPCLD